LLCRATIKDAALSEPLKVIIASTARTIRLDYFLMASQLVASPAASAPQTTAAQRFASLLVRRRVPISVALFAAIVLVDLFVLHSRPRDVLNVADPLALLSVLLILAGLAVRTWAAGTLRKRRELARTGPYAWIRHPLYFGSFLMMVGFGTLIQDPLTLWVVAGPLAWMYWQAVKSEERHIAKLFPADWPPYAAAVPRFLPFRPVRPSFADWSLAQWLHNSEYQAWLGSALALIAIKIWQMSA
jgi:protein-S-isoprenylcysteine O-methyltransferase Ste14